MMVSTAGKAIKWDESEARPMGRDTMGVKGMTIKKGEACLGMEIAPEGSELFVVTERGYGKRTPAVIPEHHRAGRAS
jgi:DNA gyrase subunit A